MNIKMKAVAHSDLWGFVLMDAGGTCSVISWEVTFADDLAIGHVLRGPLDGTGPFFFHAENLSTGRTVPIHLEHFGLNLQSAVRELISFPGVTAVQTCGKSFAVDHNAAAGEIAQEILHWERED